MQTEKSKFQKFKFPATNAQTRTRKKMERQQCGRGGDKALQNLASTLQLRDYMLKRKCSKWCLHEELEEKHVIPGSHTHSTIGRSKYRCNPL